MSLQDVINKSLIDVLWADVSFNSVTADVITANTIHVLNPPELDVLKVNTIEGNTTPTIVNLNANLVPSVDATYSIGSTGSAFNTVYSNDVTSLTLETDVLSGHTTFVDVAVDANFFPLTDGVRQLGKSTNNFTNGFINDLHSNSIKVDSILGKTSQDVNVNIQGSGNFNVSSNASPNQVQITSTGTILTNNVGGTSNVIVADGSGNQIAYGSQNIIGTNALTMVAQNNLQIGSNTGNVGLTPTGSIDLNPGTEVNVTQQIKSSAGGPQYADAAGSSGLSVGAGVANLGALGGGRVICFSGGVSVTGDTIPSNDASYKLGDASGNKWLDVAADTAHIPALLSVSSINASSSLTDNRFLGVDETGALSFYKPEHLLLFSAASVPIIDGTYFLTTGSATIEGSYFDNSYTIKKVTACASGTTAFNFGGGTATLSLGHVPSGSLVEAANYVSDFSASLNTGAAFYNYSSGNVLVNVGASNLVGRLVLSGTTPTGTITSFIVAVYVEAN